MQEPPPSPDELEYRKQAMLDLLEQSSKKKAKEPPPLPSPPPEPSSLEKFKQLRSRYLKRTPLQLHYDRFLSSKFVTNLRKEQLRNKTYTSLLSYYTAKDLKKAYQEYKKIQGQALTPDLRLYSVVIDLLGRYRKYSEQARVYEQMLARGLEPDELIYIRMILSCIEQMEFPRAEKIILEAKKKGVHSLRFYGRILKQYAHLEHWNLAQKFWETELLPSGIAPDLQMYTLAGKMYYRLRNIDKSLAIFEEAASKFGLDDKAISVYLLAYCRLHTVPEVEQKFMELTAKSPPTLYTYTSLLKVYISDDRLGEALKILQKMQNQEGTRPSVVTYTVILAKLGREKRMVSVWYIFQLLKDEGVFPDARLWEVMLKAHLDKNGHNVVDAFVRELRKKNIFPAFSVKFILRLYYFYRDEQDMEMANWLLSAGVDGSRKRLEEAS
jgi:pentatricopeptide repeat protein